MPSSLKCRGILGFVFLVCNGRAEFMPAGCVREFMDFKDRHVLNTASCPEESTV